MKMTSAKNERHHFPVCEHLQSAIYNGHFCPTSNIQGRGVCQEQHSQNTQALPRAPVFGSLGAWIKQLLGGRKGRSADGSLKKLEYCSRPQLQCLDVNKQH